MALTMFLRVIIKAIGVATKTLSNGKTYMAMVVTYTVEYGTVPTQPAQ